MFKQNNVDAVLTRLSQYFGNSLVMRPPATMSSLAQLERIEGSLPGEFVAFLSACNGLCIGKETCDRIGHLWGTQEILDALESPSRPKAPSEFLPISGDPSGERDWLILDGGPVEGTILRWDPWLPYSELVGSSFGAYLRSWVEYVLLTHMPDGSLRARMQPRPLFNVQFCEKHDARLAALCREARTDSWMRQVAQAVACGDDYE